MATATIQLRTEAIEAIKKSLTAKNALQFELNISFQTLQRWLRENSSNLTKKSAIIIICRELSMTEEEVLTELVAA